MMQMLDLALKESLSSWKQKGDHFYQIINNSNK